MQYNKIKFNSGASGIKIALIVLFSIFLNFQISNAQITDPAMNSKLPYTDHFVPSYFEKQVFAHRGGYANGPENTKETILKNLSKNITCMEVDVQLTKDSQLVLFHDETVERVLTTSSIKKVSELTLKELKSFPLRDKSMGEVYITTFKELVDTLTYIIPAKKLDFLIELDWKPHGKECDIAIDAMVSILNEKLKIFGDSFYNYFFLSTFYPDVLKAVNKKAPRVVTGFAVHNNPISNKFKAKMAVRLANHFIKKHHVKIIEPNLCLVSNRFVKKWHKRGILINVYTANSECEKAYLKKLNIAFTTNCPIGFCNNDPSDQMTKPKKWCKKCSKDNNL